MSAAASLSSCGAISGKVSTEKFAPAEKDTSGLKQMPSAGTTIALIDALDMATRVNAGSDSANGGVILWSNGLIETSVRFPATGTYQFFVTAKGSYGGEAWPLMEVRIDGARVGAPISVNSSSWKTFNLSAAVSAGSHRVALAFVNDYSNSSTGEDRNLWVETLRIQTPEAPASGSAPSAPSGLAGRAIASHRVDLEWVDQSGNETGFRVERSQDGQSYGVIATLGAGATAYQALELTPSTRYYFRIKSYNSCGSSAASSVVSLTTPSTLVPAAPTSLSAQAVSSSAIQLKWADNSSQETGFKVESSLDGIAYQLAGTVGANLLSFTHSGLTASTHYHYRVYSYNASGSSSADQASAVTLTAVVPSPSPSPSAHPSSSPSPSPSPIPSPKPSPSPSPTYTGGPLPVFPGAVGFGTKTRAGRGGAILKVTNLNDSGAGSLRAALEAAGPRIVVFEVGGTITLLSNITIWNPYLTIAGQTAPSPGIHIKGAGFVIRAHNVLMQHLTIRPGTDVADVPIESRDAIFLKASYTLLPPEYGVYNVVIDHVSTSWAVDENVSTWQPIKDVTFSNMIISEGLENSIHPQGPHSKGLLVGPSAHNVAIVGNLFAHNGDRNPEMSGDTWTYVANNVIYDAVHNWAGPVEWQDGYNYGPSKGTLVGNAMMLGPNGGCTYLSIFQSMNKIGSEIFVHDNIRPGTEFINKASFDPRVGAPPVVNPGYVSLPASVTEASVLAKAGSRPRYRDPVDARIVREVQTRTGRMIDSVSQVGGYPVFPKTYRALEIPANPHADDDGDGYTNIEELLHRMAAAVE